jgi:HSP20 family protein
MFGKLIPRKKKNEGNIKVSGNVLTLRAEHKEEGKEENGSYRRYGSFSETFTLPGGVLPDKIDASYHSGVLEVHLPKSEECQAKRIPVTAA